MRTSGLAIVVGIRRACTFAGIAVGAACGGSSAGQTGADAAGADRDVRPGTGLDASSDVVADGGQSADDGPDAAGEAGDASSGADAADLEGGKPALDGALDAARSAVWPDDASKLLAENSGGGFVGAPPAGSACALGQATYTVTVADKHLVWQKCDASVAGAPYRLVAGDTLLNAAEYASLVAALRSVTLFTGTTCGADKPLLKMTVTTPAGPAEYLDSFYACQRQGTYVDGIDGVFAVLSPLAR